MTPDRHDRICELFAAVVDLPPEERRTHLEQACASDTELRAEVERLLERDRHPAALDATLPRKLREGLAVALDAAGGIPARIGAYEILGVLGHGGMGTVYRARQAQPERMVAVKVLNGAAPALRRRFEFEALVLARLQHPGIARVYDAGVAEQAIGPVAYFAMELVEGAPLTEYADRAALSVRERLALVQRVCEAVMHAHQKGVIHRDLKPANILVDAQGQPRVLDFGVARLLDPELRGATFLTQTGQIVGTPAYMSPEQVAGVPDTIDVRTDVYALGVILYELLTAQFPYDVSGTMRDVMDRIVQLEPIRPRAAARHATAPRPANAALNDEVETIILKCLAKDRERRYPTVDALARDIGHFLRGEAIDAKRDSGWYVLRKALRRYRLPVIAAGATAVLLLCFGATMSVLWRRALTAESTAVAARTAAEQQAARATQIRGLLEGALTSVQPERARGRDVTVLREILDEAARRMDTQLAGQPEVEIELHNIIANTYQRISLFPECEAHARRAIALHRGLPGEPRPDLSVSLVALSIALHEQARFAEAIVAAREAVELCRAAGTERRAELISALAALATATRGLGRAADAEPLYRENYALALAHYGADDLITGKVLAGLANVLRDLGRPEEAETCYRKAIETQRRIAPNQYDIARSLSSLGLLLASQGRYDEAEPLLREALELHRGWLGEAHADVAEDWGNLATLLFARGDLAAAEGACRAAQAVLSRLGRGEHPDTAHMLHTLGVVRYRLDDLAGAEDALRAALAIRRAHLPEHRLTAMTAGELGRCLSAQGRFEEAESLLTEAYCALSATLGSRHAYALAQLERLVSLYERCGRETELVQYRAELDAARPQSTAD